MPRRSFSSTLAKASYARPLAKSWCARASLPPLELSAAVSSACASGGSDMTGSAEPQRRWHASLSALSSSCSASLGELRSSVPEGNAWKCTMRRHGSSRSEASAPASRSKSTPIGSCQCSGAPSNSNHISLSPTRGGANGRKCCRTGCVTNGSSDWRGRHMWNGIGRSSEATSSGARSKTAGISPCQTSSLASCDDIALWLA